MSLLITLYLFWAITIAVLLSLAPWLILRPTVWLSLCFGVIISSAAVFLPEQYNHPGCPTLVILRNFDDARLTTVVFPLMLLFFAAMTPQISHNYKAIFYRMSQGNNFNYMPGVGYRIYVRTTFIVISLSMFLIILYLIYVPLNQTGLFAVIFNPPEAEIAREKSLKLLDNVVVKYCFSYMISVFGPLTCALLVQVIEWNKLSLRNIAAGFTILIVTIGVMLPGERSAVALCILSGGVSYLFKVGIRRGWGKITIGVLVSIAIIMVLTFLRSDEREVSFESAISISEIIIKRIFAVPYITGIYTLQYVQDFGLTGVSTIRPLAILFGEEFVNLANEVMLHTMSGITLDNESAFMNTSFLFDFQAAFGLIPGLLISGCLIFLLDNLFVFWVKLRGRLLNALYALFLIQMLSLLSAAFFTSLNTHGILWSCLLASIIGHSTSTHPKKSNQSHLTTGSLNL